MGTEEPTSSQTQGTVNGKSAVLRIDETQFSWREERQDSLDRDAEWLHIPIKNIITATRAPSGSSGEYSILYTIENEAAKGDAKESPFLFESLIASNLPGPLIRDFEQANALLWRTGRDGTQNASIVHVVVSTGSGTGLASVVWEQLVKPMLRYNGLTEEDYALHSTTSEASVTELTKNVILPHANEGVNQSMLLLSGDGGIVDIVNALLSGERSETYKKPIISLLPLGTGNAMANSAGITSDSTIGLRTLLLGSPKEVPLFRATFSPGARLLVSEGREERHLEGIIDGMPVAHGAVVCSWGLHAGLVADSDTAEYRKFGAERFKMAAKEALFPSDGSWPHAYKGKVSILRTGKSEWEAIPRHEHGYVLATLVSNLEAGFTISPSSRPLDGKLRLVHFGHLSGQEAMDVMRKAYQGGKHVEDDRVGYEEIVGLKIEFDEDDARWRRVCLDGKIVRVEKGGWVEVRREVEGVVDLISKNN